jgi:hypothetical protein
MSHESELSQGVKRRIDWKPFASYEAVGELPPNEAYSGRFASIDVSPLFEKMNRSNYQRVLINSKREVTNHSTISKETSTCGVIHSSQKDNQSIVSIQHDGETEEEFTCAERVSFERHRSNRLTRHLVQSTPRLSRAKYKSIG